MIECPSCGRVYPEVVGAPTQVCPHCRYETTDRAPAAGRAALPPADPAGAVALALRVARREYPRFLLIFLPALVLEIGIGFAIAAYERGSGAPADPALMTTGQQMQLLGVLLPLMLLLLTVRYALWTIVAARVLDVVLGGRRLASWGKLLVPALVMGLILTLAYAAGMLLLLVGYLVLLHWWLYAPAQLAMGAPSIGEAFERSRRFARDRRTYGFTALVVLIGLGILVPYLLTDVLPGWMGIIVPALILWVGGVINPLLAASYVALAANAAPAREEPPLVVRLTTKCPRCAELIPYEKSGDPIECPTCGYAGRVL